MQPKKVSRHFWKEGSLILKNSSGFELHVTPGIKAISQKYKAILPRVMPDPQSS
jgi:hypothetical protein